LKRFEPLWISAVFTYFFAYFFAYFLLDCAVGIAPLIICTDLVIGGKKRKAIKNTKKAQNKATLNVGPA
jgi:hypothetical protein